MRRAAIAGALLAAAALLAGCAAPALRNPSGPGGDLRVSFAPPNVQPSRRDAGVFASEDDDRVRVKARRQAVLSLIDEVAYRRGFNYRVLSDLTAYQVDLHGRVAEPLPGEPPSSDWERTEQREFANERALFDAVLQQVNTGALAAQPVKLRYRWRSDGPEFHLAADGGPEVVCNERAQVAPACDVAQIAYKKFFVRNVYVDEAVRSLRALFFKDEQAPASADPPGINKANVDNTTLAVYRPQNAIVMRSTDGAVLDKVSQALFALDASYQQVLVETLIFQYDESVGRRLGAALDFKRENVSADGTRTLTSQIVTQFGNQIADSLPRLFFGQSDTEKRATLLAKLALYDNDGFVRVLAEPRLLLQSGESAAVELKTTKYVLTTGVNTGGAVERLPTGITLRIVPTVLGNGKVRLAVELGQSEFVSTADTGIVATTVDNKVVTSVIVADGEMISIGGIHTRRDSRSDGGLPGLRDVPVAGLLFGSQTSDATRSRIEFMIRPTVERSAQRLRSIQGNIEKANVMVQREVDARGGKADAP